MCFLFIHTSLKDCHISQSICVEFARNAKNDSDTISNIKRRLGNITENDSAIIHKASDTGEEPERLR